MQQETAPILSYERQGDALRYRRPTLLGFSMGWLAGVPLGFLTLANLLGSAGLPSVFDTIGSIIMGVPAFFICKPILGFFGVGNWAAFAVATIASAILASIFPDAVIIVAMIIALLRGERIIC